MPHGRSSPQKTSPSADPAREGERDTSIADGCRGWFTLLALPRKGEGQNGGWKDDEGHRDHDLLDADCVGEMSCNPRTDGATGEGEAKNEPSCQALFEGEQALRVDHEHAVLPTDEEAGHGTGNKSEWY